MNAPVLVLSWNIEQAWDLYYELADRHHNPGLTFDELVEVVAAALGETREVYEWTTSAGRSRRFCTEWEPYGERRVEPLERGDQ